MPQVDHLGAGALDDAPSAVRRIDGGILPIEEGSGSDHADLVLGDVGRGLHEGGGHGGEVTGRG